MRHSRGSKALVLLAALLSAVGVGAIIAIPDLRTPLMFLTVILAIMGLVGSLNLHRGP
jgi:hypothetical protein